MSFTGVTRKVTCGCQLPMSKYLTLADPEVRASRPQDNGHQEEEKQRHQHVLSCDDWMLYHIQSLESRMIRSLLFWGRCRHGCMLVPRHSAVDVGRARSG